MKKIVCISVLICFVIPLLVTGETPISENDGSSAHNYEKDTEIPCTSTDLTIALEQARLSFGVNLVLTNEGNQRLDDITWSFRGKPVISGTGLIRQSQSSQGTISELGAGETETIEFRPFDSVNPSPLGFGNTYLNASAQVGDIQIRTQQRTDHFLFFLYNYQDTYKDIPPAVAYQMYLDEIFELIIDVVGLDIYSLGHLPGAVNYIWADGTLNSKIPTLDKEGTYLVYCHTDPPSTDSAQSLIDAGITNVYRLEGNYRAWVDAGYPTEP